MQTNSIEVLQKMESLWPTHVDADSQYNCKYCGAAPCWHL